MVRLALALLAIGGSSWVGGPLVRVAAAQSLADVARSEAERRDAVNERGWVYNNFNIRPAPPRQAEEPEPPPESPSNDVADAEAVAEPPAAETSFERLEPGAGDKRTEEQWRAQAVSLDDRIARLRTSQSGLKNRLGELRRLSEGLSEKDTAAVGRESLRVGTALAKVERDLSSLERAWAGFAEDARRANVPSSWLEPSEGGSADPPSLAVTNGSRRRL